ncbi:unnamed protein product [Peronospora effusa]|nr:unnamed protein product [Peronospora effusa]
MKPLTSLLFVGLAFSSTICAEDCTQSKLLAIASSSYVKGCISKVGLESITSISTLTDEKIKAVCDSSDCMALMDEMRTIIIDDCNIPDTTISLKKDLLDPFKKACSSSGSADLSSSSVGATSVGSTASDSTSSSVSATVLPVSWVSAVALVVATLVLQ